jgi:Protein of unknown function (DUF1501)
MLNLQIASQGRRGRIDRRTFMALTTLGGLGLSFPNTLSARSPTPTAGLAGFGRARRCILLFLTGGPPQLDTWDLKPEAPAEVRGELRPIATTVPGIRISELFPRLARSAHRYCIVRSVTHGDAVHTSAGYTMLTGAVHPRAGNPGGAASIRPSVEDFPHLGSVVARFGAARAGLPTFVSLPEVIRDAGVNELSGQGAGFLGRRYDPVRIDADAERTGFRFPDLVLPEDVTADRLQERRFLQQRLDRALVALESQRAPADLNAWYQSAYGLLQSPAVRRAFELDREPVSVRRAYGPSLFGQGCLLARRLVETGVQVVTVYWHYEGPDDSPVWDTHENNFAHLRNRLMPPTDQALSALLEDLEQRGLLGDTLVVCFGEFGRSPRINGRGGREHWPQLQSVVLAGAGIPSGSVYGVSDRHGAYPADQPVSPGDLAATALHLLGIPHDVEAHDQTGRPVRLGHGRPVAGLLREA